MAEQWGLPSSNARQSMFARTKGEEHRDEIPVSRLCEIMGVGPRGDRAWRRRPLGNSQRRDRVVVPAHIREQVVLSLGRYAVHDS